MPNGETPISDAGPAAASAQTWDDLFLIADDLTGALDTAAQFVGLFGPVSVYWRVAPSSGSVALDSGTRELSGADAERAVAARFAGRRLEGATLCYAKLDSLLRGHPAHEIAAWLRHADFARCVIAPAFPAQGRITREGRQFHFHEGRWAPVVTDLLASLRELDIEGALCHAGDPVPAGVSLWNATSDADLDAIVAARRATTGNVLWCGSGGLASALARSAGRSANIEFVIARPALGLFGSDQPVAAAQFESCGDCAFTLTDGGPASAAKLARSLDEAGAALARVAIPVDVSREEAAKRVAREFGRLLDALTPPATLLVIGGETLRAVCEALGADHLELAGQIEPGIPVSVLRGGRFNGVRVVSKSGAFGDRELVKRLLTHTAPLSNGVPA